ncbi:hypothetical protein P8452_75133 [Trifolium repens]|nr:hypothetical protein P8452_75133 [Trifolium repens]
MEEDENDDGGEEYVNDDGVEDIESLDQKGLGPIQGWTKMNGKIDLYPHLLEVILTSFKDLACVSKPYARKKEQLDLRKTYPY